MAVPNAGDAWTEATLTRAVYRHFAARYAVLVQVPASDPEAQATYATWSEELRRYRLGGRDGRPPAYVPEPGHRRIDVLLWAPGDRIALELKVTRADLLADIADPAKQRVWRELAHRHAYVVPHGLADKAEVPTDSGLIVVTGSALGWAKRAPKRRNTPPELPALSLHVLMRRLAWAEGRLKGHAAEPAESPAELEAEAARLRRALEVETDAHHRTRERAEHYRKLASNGTGWPCRACGEPLSATWSARRGESWRHRAGGGQDAACEALRAAQLQARRDAGERHAYDGGARPAELEELATTT